MKDRLRNALGTLILIFNYTVIEVALMGLAMRFRTSPVYILVFACGSWAIAHLQEELESLLARRWLAFLLTVVMLALSAVFGWLIYRAEYA